MDYIIRPVMEEGWMVLSFRMVWPRQDEAERQQTWDNIVSYSYNLDSLVEQLPDTVFFVSGIGASHRRGKEAGSFDITPSLMFWVVMTNSTHELRALTQHMMNNQLGATLKLQLQPFQQTEDHLAGALYKSVKDNIEGFVRLRVDRSSALYGQRKKEPIVKVYLKDMVGHNIVSTAVNALRCNANFHMHFVDLIQGQGQ